MWRPSTLALSQDEAVRKGMWTPQEGVCKISSMRVFSTVSCTCTATATSTVDVFSRFNLPAYVAAMPDAQAEASRLHGGISTYRFCRCSVRRVVLHGIRCHGTSRSHRCLSMLAFILLHLLYECERKLRVFRPPLTPLVPS